MLIHRGIVTEVYIHADKEIGRTTKISASRRKVSLHPKLIALGFLAFVELQRKQQEKVRTANTEENVRLFTTFRASGKIQERVTNVFSK